MITGNYPLSRKETFSVSMVIFIGLYYFLSLASSLFQTQSIQAGRIFGLTECKFLLLALFYSSGAFSFFRQKNRGWIICTATLLNYILVLANAVVTISQTQSFDRLAAMIISFFVLLLMAFFFLFGKDTRKKFMVNNKSYLLMMAVYVMLLLVTFLM